MLPPHYSLFMVTKIIVHKKNSILAEAMDVLLEHLGFEKTVALWQVLSPPGGDYLSVRKKIFAGKDLKTIFKGAKRFNRSSKGVGGNKVKRSHVT